MRKNRVIGRRIVCCLGVLSLAFFTAPLMFAAELRGTVIMVQGKLVTIKLDDQGFLSKDDKVEIYQDAYGVKVEFGTWKVSGVDEEDTIQAKPEKTEANPQLKLNAIIHATGSKESHAKLVLDQAVLFEKGLEGAEKNMTKAVRLYRKAAEIGSAKSGAILCDIYSDEQSGQTDYSEAVTWCLEAAKQGTVWAQARMGHLYTFGKGVKADLEEAEKWYREADATSRANYIKQRKLDPDTPAYRKNYLLNFATDLLAHADDSSLPGITPQEAYARAMKLDQEMRSEKR